MILETKFDIGQEVYFLYDLKITKGKIHHLNINGIFNEESKKEAYTVNFSENKVVVMGGNELFNSPEELADYLLNEFYENN